MKRIWTLFLFITMISLVTACSNSDDAQAADSKNNAEEAKEDSQKNLSKLSEEELATHFFNVITTGDVEGIYENAYEGQLDSLKNGINQIEQQLNSAELSMEVEEVLGKVTLEEYTLVVLLNKIMDKEGNILNYTTGQIGLMNVDGQSQYVWDFTTVPDHIVAQEAQVVEQLNALMENDQKVMERIQWAEEQNRLHQEAFNLHIQAQQQAVDQQNQVNQQQQQQQQQMQQQQQQMQQQMMTPPPGF
ncbi:hypothetical protein [Salirhabdus sp. Marseille-P4669]|uniref:hypothetical protein n=1 Tax=Salirhabdus sp. Marseille-P4669 TaxID=2042310 RepID=UPI000C7BDC88|nr:hypothetical protein [Salirhabdus sp. Marseille-P4669]